MTERTDKTDAAITVAIADAVAHHRAGRLADAGDAYRKVLDRAPDHPGALHNLGVLAAQQQMHGDALALFDRALAARPDYADAHLNRAGVLQAMGRLDEALAAYGRAAALRPDNPEPRNGMGDTLRRLGRMEDAAARYRDALSCNPAHYRARLGLALALTALGRLDDAMSQFDATLALRRGDTPLDPDHYSFTSVSRAKLRHDCAQFRHLAAQGIDAKNFETLAAQYDALERVLEWPADDAQRIALGDRRAGIAASYNRPIHRADAPAMADGALNRRLDSDAIARRYAETAPGVAWFDDMLTDAALATLRRFLVESTVWFDFAHIGGFVAAYMEDGLACPLLLQIAEELRAAFPAVFRGEPLSQAWAFKCLAGDKGIDVHADAATVSVNFWVTPDEANLDPDRGGLIVYRTAPPPDWHLRGYDSDIGRIRAFLAAHDTQDSKITIPYRANRAVFFNSDLFHGSDRVSFRPGYANHRINVTLLFGPRKG